MNYNRYNNCHSNKEVIYHEENVQRLLTISILTSMTGAGIFAVNKLINASAVIRNALHNKSQYFYDWKFGRIHYTIEGSGSPLLLFT